MCVGMGSKFGRMAKEIEEAVCSEEKAAKRMSDKFASDFAVYILKIASTIAEYYLPFAKNQVEDAIEAIKNPKGKKSGGATFERDGKFSYLNVTIPKEARTSFNGAASIKDRLLQLGGIYNPFTKLKLDAVNVMAGTRLSYIIKCKFDEDAESFAEQILITAIGYDTLQNFVRNNEQCMHTRRFWSLDNFPVRQLMKGYVDEFIVEVLVAAYLTECLHNIDDTIKYVGLDYGGHIIQDIQAVIVFNTAATTK